MKRMIFLLIMALFGVGLTGCTANVYTKQMQAWEGRSAEDLMRVWGTPHMVQPFVGNKEIYLYRYDQEYYEPSTAPHWEKVRVNDEWKEVRVPGKTARRTRKYCENRFIISPEGTIESTRWRGDSCF